MRYKITQRDKNILKNLGKQKPSKYTNFDFTNTVVCKPWGMEYLFFEDKKLDACGWMLHIIKGLGTSIHCHKTKNTVLVVISGLLHLRLTSNRQLLTPGSITYIDKKVFYALTAIEEDTRVIELETPSKKSDSIRAVDLWNRRNEPYESKCLIMAPERRQKRLSEATKKKMSIELSKIVKPSQKALKECEKYGIDTSNDGRFNHNKS